MQLKDLQNFQLVADLGSLHAAAAMLGVTQPALSKSLRRLETSLGVRLFERTPRGVALTSIGRALYARNRTLGQLVDDIQTEIHDLKTGQSGELRIGSVPALVDGVVSPVLAGFAAGDEPVRFRVHVQLSGALLRELTSGYLDFAVPAIHDAVPAELGYAVLGDQSSHVIARRGHPLARRKFALDDLARQPWVLPPGDVMLRTWVETLFRGKALPAPHVFVEADSSPVAFAGLVRRSDVLTVMTADSLASPVAADLLALPAPAPTWPLQIGLFWRRSAYFSGLMRECREALVRAFAARELRRR